MRAHPTNQPIVSRKTVAGLTADRVRELLDYNPETGVLVRKYKSLVPSAHQAIDSMGYVTFRLTGKLFRGHRLAWLHFYGVWPQGVIDHINGDKLDNRIVNLRDVPRAVNTQNQRKAAATNRTGFLGVFKQGGRFFAQIQFRGKSMHIGCFDSAEEAHAAYVMKKRELHEGCTL